MDEIQPLACILYFSFSMVIYLQLALWFHIHGFNQMFFFFFFFLFFGSFCLIRATPAAYGDSQARGTIRAMAASLSHSNAWSKPCLWPTPQLMACWILNPLSEARDQTCNLTVPSWIHFCYTMTGTPEIYILNVGLAYQIVKSWKELCLLYLHYQVYSWNIEWIKNILIE